MRRVFLFCAASVLAGCAKTENPPPADSAAAMAPPAPTPIALADVAGKWDVKGTREGSDSTIITYVFTATADTTGWSITFPNRKPVPVRVVAVSGDSINIEAGPFDSALRKGLKVRSSAALRLQDGKLVGMTTARYVTTKADSVLLLHTEGTRTP